MTVFNNFNAHPVHLFLYWETSDAANWNCRHLVLNNILSVPQEMIRTLEKCYVNAKKAYNAKSSPPLESDHNTVYLIPTYRIVWKSFKPVTKDVLVWSEGSTESLNGCFLCTE